MNSCIFISLSLLLAAAASADVGVVGAGKELRQPFSVVFVPDGTMLGVEYEEGNRVFALEPGREFRFIAGRQGEAGKKLGDIAEGDGESAGKAVFNGMHDLTLAPDGRLFIADTFNNRVRVIDLAKNTVDTFAGMGGEGGFGGDGGPARKATFNGLYTVDLSPDAKRLLLADLGNRRVREIDLETGTIKTVAGNGRRGIPEDGGQALEQPLVAPRAACYGRDGKTIYIASREGHALREVTPDGRIRTVVNPEGKKGYSGDGGSGLTAQLNGPKHLCLDPDGNVVISDDQNQCIRLYRPEDGTIHLLAGVPGKAGDKIGKGPLDTELNRPHGARYDKDGNLHVADSWNHRILKFTTD